MIKIKNKDTRTTPLSRVSIANFEHVNAAGKGIKLPKTITLILLRCEGVKQTIYFNLLSTVINIGRSQSFAITEVKKDFVMLN